MSVAMEPQAAGEDYCYLTTSGRMTGRDHSIEIWFASGGEATIYLLSGGGNGSDWVRNIVHQPRVSLRVGGDAFAGRGRIVSDPDEAERARELVVSKYQPRYRGDLSDWRQRSLPVAIDLVLQARPEPSAGD